MKKEMRSYGCVWLFVFLFVYTAVSKWIDYARFEWVLSDSPLLAPFAKPVAMGLPALELVTAALLCFSATRRMGMYLTTALMLLFTGYIGYMLTTASSLPCSCGGMLRLLNWEQHFWLNVLLLLLAAGELTNWHAFIFLLRNNRKSAENL